MPRFPRVNLEGALYYITTKANYKLNLFRDDSDKNRYLSFLFEYKNLYNFKLFSLVLIPTESHLLIEPSQQFTVSQIMHDVNANYTKYYNKKYETKGHLFEERFKAVLVEKKSLLLEITRFVHRIILKENILTQLKDYKWSSYPAYLRIEADKNILSNIDCDEALNLLSPAENRSAAYQQFVEKSSRQEIEAFENKMYRASVVGSEDFVEKIREISKAAAEAGQEQPDENTEASLKKSKRNRMALVSLILLVFFGTSAFFIIGNANLKREIKETALEKDEIFVKDLIATKQEVSKDLEEKYRADMVSYKVTAMRLQELEKKDRQKGEKL